MAAVVALALIVLAGRVAGELRDPAYPTSGSGRTGGEVPGTTPVRASSGLVVDPGWVADTAAAARIPPRAVRAYGAAVLRLHLTRPDCAIGWTTLAGVGLVESVHGTIAGRTLRADGYSSRRILGPALDGRGDFAAIPATADSVRWHGDPVWDHAVGPMQFIPSTWRLWGSDGDGDGVANPNDLDDAAYAAARYLCSGGHDLASGAGWEGAVFAYNHAEVYVDAVHRAASDYARRAA